MNTEVDMDTDEMSTAEEPVDGETPESPEAPTKRDRQVFVGLVVAVVALLVAGVWQADRLRDQGADEDQRAEVVEVASEQAITLLGISKGNVEERIEALRKHSTGEFEQQLIAIAASFTKLVEEGEVTSSGEVVSAAVADLRDEDARVLLALSSQVTNSETKEPEPRAYRITVDLAKEDDKWLVAGMQFAP